MTHDRKDPMRSSYRLTRLLAVVLAATFLILAVHLPSETAQAAQHPRVAECRGKRTEALIGCLARNFDAPGSPSFAVRVADCESGLHPHAVSPSGTFRGLFQEHRGYWPARWRHYARPLGLRSSIFSAISNTVVSLRLARSAGDWHDWSCAYGRAAIGRAAIGP